MNSKPVLVIEGSERDARRLEQLIIQFGANCLPVWDLSGATEHLQRSNCSLVVVGRSSGTSTIEEFLNWLQDRFSQVPVLVLTGEQKSITSVPELPGNILSSREVLQRPIAGCLPRSNIATDFVRTLRELIEDPSSNRIPCETICHTLENNPDLLPLVVSQVRQRLETWPFADPIEPVRVAVALSEALDNAVFHGNMELSSDLRQGDGRGWREESLRRRTVLPYCDRRVRFRAIIGRQSAEFTIRDEGAGFDPINQSDCTSTQNLELCSGRGLMLMKMYMDDVQFNAVGNEVTLIKYHPINKE